LIGSRRRRPHVSVSASLRLHRECDCRGVGVEVGMQDMHGYCAARLHGA
jgi:hypothetical protein